jgi:hypothetical protein
VVVEGAAVAVVSRSSFRPEASVVDGAGGVAAVEVLADSAVEAAEVVSVDSAAEEGSVAEAVVRAGSVVCSD